MAGPRGASRFRRRAGGDGKPRGTAKDRALRLLGIRARSRRELEVRLRRAGFEAEEVQAALGDLERAGLIDDARFAEAVVEQAATGRLRGRRAVFTTLLAQGVARDTAERVLEGFEEGDYARALDLASRQAARLRSHDREGALRRTYGLLVRRGFDPETARRATASAFGRSSEEE